MSRLAALFVCVRNMNVCLHHMLNYCLCLCVRREESGGQSAESLSRS